MIYGIWGKRRCSKEMFEKILSNGVLCNPFINVLKKHLGKTYTTFQDFGGLDFC